MVSQEVGDNIIKRLAPHVPTFKVNLLPEFEKSKMVQTPIEALCFHDPEESKRMEQMNIEAQEISGLFSGLPPEAYYQIANQIDSNGELLA